MSEGHKIVAPISGSAWRIGLENVGIQEDLMGQLNSYIQTVI